MTMNSKRKGDSMATTNPNPVAPKTDTPATQIPADLKTLYGNAQAFRHAFGSDRFVGAGTVEVLIERIANLESTLAAERASRLQADTEQFNAGIEAALGHLRRVEEISVTNWDRATMHGLIAGIERLSKPSVSPEQAEETK